MRNKKLLEGSVLHGRGNPELDLLEVCVSYSSARVLPFFAHVILQHFLHSVLQYADLSQCAAVC